MIGKAGAQLVIVDPLIACTACRNNENADMRRTLAGRSRIMAKAGVSAIMVHNTKINQDCSVQNGHEAQATSDGVASIIFMAEAEDWLAKVVAGRCGTTSFR